MMVGARTGAWSGKPLPYLRRVAYLESDGSQYIDTLVDTGEDFVANNSVEIELNPTRIVSTDNFFGNGVSYANGYTLAFTSQINVGLQTSNGIVCCRGFGIVEKGLWHTLRSSQNGIEFDGIEIPFYSNSYPVSGSAFLFACRRNGVYFSGYTFKGKIRKAVIQKGGIVILHLNPVIDLSGRPAMYDEVSGQFFYNQGTGEFTWGELTE